MSDGPIRFPSPCLVVLVGASASGKSTWAAATFLPDEVVSSDRLRAVVGHSEDDLDASADAFALLDTIVGQRLGRGLTTVVDTLGLDPARRAGYREVAERNAVPCVAVAFPVTLAELRARNRERTRPVPADVLQRQAASFREQRTALAGEPFAAVHEITPSPTPTSPARATPPAEPSSPAASGAADRRDGRVRFGLHLSSFGFVGKDPTTWGPRLAEVGRTAEAAGFESIWVMDHHRQIPQVGRDWDPMPEAHVALAWLAAATTTVRIGTLVTPVTFRNVGHLARTVATLDVLSGGRMVCGLGAGWYQREHDAFGLAFPPAGERLDLLEDAIGGLRACWGPGAKPFAGRRLSLPEAMGYPRPIQDPVPILVGGGGERRTLRISAALADAVNLLGDVDVVRHKVAVLRAHCADIGRAIDDIEISHLSTTLLGSDRAALRDAVDQLRPRNVDAARFGASVHAGTVDDQVERFTALAATGVSTAIVSLPDLALDPTTTVPTWTPLLSIMGA